MGASLLILFFAALFVYPTSGKCEELPGYWFWAGRSVLNEAPVHSLYYIHQGTLERGSKTGRSLLLRPHGAAPVKTSSAGIFLVFRLERIEVDQSFLDIVTSKLKTWEGKGNRVLGIQIDYDSPTRALIPYVDFLRRLRRDLPPEYQLSVTGLADWAANASEDSLLALSGVADEIVFQLYNGRKGIPDIPRYLRRMTTMQLSFRIGLLNNQEISLEEREKLQKNPHFRGWVYFLPGTPLGRKPEPLIRR